MLIFNRGPPAVAPDRVHGASVDPMEEWVAAPGCSPGQKKTGSLATLDTRFVVRVDGIARAERLPTGQNRPFGYTRY